MTKPNPAQTANTKPTMADILDRKKPLEVEVQVLIDPSYQERYRELENAKTEAQRNARSGKADISQPGPEKYDRLMEELLEEAADSVVTFRFRDIGRKNLDALAREHPPTKDQQDTYKKLGAPGVLEYNVDTFGPELVAASCIEPEITVQQAQTIFDDWGRRRGRATIQRCPSCLPRSGLYPFIQERFRRDLDFQLQVNYCAEKGIPYGWFIGGEWEWDEYSRNCVIVWSIEQSLRCSDCGTRRDEWDEKKGGDRHAYYAVSYTCEGCKERDAKAAALSKDAKGLGMGSTMEGVKIQLMEKEEYGKLMEGRREKERERAMARQARAREKAAQEKREAESSTTD